ncbi:dihydrodipicolinate synthase family protein [Paenibacillus andongensis]|uniref:dihydrodipicolinate synthase family protein n=1 Tax=Paenibacillus andongensis TaxID=2975482 RepID=UPI0021BAC9D3|nr:dihydrodipicolinate synthase family protein [Paenibacillus andongensis]
MSIFKPLTPEKYRALHEGQVIPAHPLALNAAREMDERRQRALTRYYMASGTGGIAVAVHTTQFEIRDKEHNLFEKVLKLASEEVKNAKLNRPFLQVAGICGPTEQAVYEAETAVGLGYDLGLVSMGGLQSWTENDLLKRIAKIAEIIPVFGFYLQPSVGGRVLSYDFWKEFANISGVAGIKMAPFNRYQTIDVVRAVCNSERRDEIALYTGNDDNIVNDLLTTYHFVVNGNKVEKKIVGGLLGHWSVWTQKAVELLDAIKLVRNDESLSSHWLTRNIEVTDSNAAFFDTANGFAGCIAGIHEVLRRQGLLEGRWCLNPEEGLSNGQMEEIDRVYRNYPSLNDDEFVKKHLSEWLAD